MSNKLNALNPGQVLGRSEMKKIMAGSGCTPGNDCTNCVICQISHYCITHVGPTPGPGCTYGICDDCPQP
jgi:hypothetical protein